MDLQRPSVEFPALPFGDSKESRSENSDSMKNNHQLSSGGYESMRMLIERQERDLGELREFANLERESLQFHVLEQQERINTFVKIQSETQLSVKENCQIRKKSLSYNNRGGSRKVNHEIFIVLNSVSYEILQVTTEFFKVCFSYTSKLGYLSATCLFSSGAARFLSVYILASSKFSPIFLSQENSCPNVGDDNFQLLKIQLAQCQADLKLIKDSSCQDVLISNSERLSERSCSQTLKAQSAREVFIMDSIL